MAMTEQELLEKLSTLTGEERAPYEEQYQALLAAKNTAPAEDIVSDEPFIFRVGVQTINLRDYVVEADSLKAESNYQVLKIAITQKLYEMEAQRQKDIENLTALKDQQIQQYKNQLEAAQQAAEAKYHELEAQYEDSNKRLEAASLEVDDLRNKVKQLEALKDKPNYATNMDNDALVKAIQEAEQAKRAIYDYVEVDGRTATAKFLDTDEVVTFNPLYKGKYRIATAEEVQRFREEREAAKASVPETPVEDNMAVRVPVPEAFQGETENAEMGGDSTVQEVHGESAPGGMESLEARVKLLEEKVAKLEAQSESVVAA